MKVLDRNYCSIFRVLLASAALAFISITADAGMYFVHSDQVGAPKKLSNSSRQVVWRAENRGYGEGVYNDDADGDGRKVTMPVRYPGQYFDDESGLHYNYFRYYDPKLGRYITSDPIGLAGGINTYEYVGGNPLGSIDPWGLVDLPYFKAFDPVVDGMKKTNHPNEITVGAHGFPGGIVDKFGLDILPERLVEDIKNHPKYKVGMTIRIYACNGGTSGEFTGKNFAREVSKLLPGHKVLAPSTYGWFNDDGFIGLYDPMITNRDKSDRTKPGEWKEYCERC